MSSLDQNKTKKDKQNHQNRVFRFIELEITNVKVINFLSKLTNKIDDIKELLRPFINLIVQSLINDVFSKDIQQIHMETKNDFILIDYNNPLIKDIVPNIKEFFSNECSIETDFKMSQYIKTCQIDLTEYSNLKSNYYYFFFIINRENYPFSVIFIGCKEILKNENGELIEQIIYINNLITEKDSKKIKSSKYLSERKKQKKEYEKKLIFYDKESTFL